MVSSPGKADGSNLLASSLTDPNKEVEEIVCIDEVKLIHSIEYRKCLEVNLPA